MSNEKNNKSKPSSPSKVRPVQKPKPPKNIIKKESERKLPGRVPNKKERR